MRCEPQMANLHEDGRESKNITLIGKMVIKHAIDLKLVILCVKQSCMTLDQSLSPTTPATSLTKRFIPLRSESADIDS